MTSVSGPKQYNQDSEQMKTYMTEGYQLDKTAEQIQFFQVITINDDTLEYVAYTALGDEYDRVVISKNFKNGRKKIIKNTSNR